MNDRDFRKNSEGYDDPTAYQAIMNADRDAMHCNKPIHTIKDMCDLEGFKVDGRITLIDQETGKVWR